MYAIISTGGKQYKVEENGIFQAENLNAKVGEQVEFDKVLMVSDGKNIEIGAPYLSNAKVIGEVTKQGRGEKISIIKFRRRKHYMRTQGHRQDFTEIKVTSLLSGAQ